MVSNTNKVKKDSVMDFKKSIFSGVKIDSSKLLVFLLIPFLFSCHNYSGKSVPKAINGVLDLREWDFEEDGPVDLGGQWEFYWEKLLDGSEETLGTTIEPDGMMDIPKQWKDHTLPDGRSLSHLGYATYKLKILLPTVTSPAGPLNNLAIKTNYIDTAYSMTVLSSEGDLLGKPLVGGIVGDSRESSVPLHRYDIASISYSPEWTVIFQVCNFHYFWGGIRTIPQMGTFKQIYEKTDNKLYLAFFTIGIILVMGIYHIIQFCLYREDRSPLWFGLLCLSVALYTLLSTCYLEYVFPDLHLWTFYMKLEYQCSFFNLLFFRLFLGSLFPGKFNKKAGKYFFIILASYFLYFFLSPYSWGANQFIFNTYLFFLVVSQALALAALIKVIVGDNNKLAKVMLAGSSFFVFCIVNDVMFQLGIFKTFVSFQYGIVVFIICQSIVIAIKNKTNHKEKYAAQREALDNLAKSDKLKGEFLQKLEQQVMERTSQLTEAKEQAVVLREKADEANRAKSIFLANMSHELRSPLNAVLGFSQILDKSPTLTEKNHKHLGIIKRSGEHLLSLINQVLSLSKIEAGKSSLNPIDFDLYRLLEELEGMFMLKAKGKNLTLSFDLDRGLERYVYGDELKIRQILINLLNNAVKFTDKGSVVLLASSRDGGEGISQNPVELTFLVKDTGIGISEKNIEKVFHPFDQAEDKGSPREGTGLGLTISREFALMMEGNLSVNSTEGDGSVFSFRAMVEQGEETHLIGVDEVRSVATIDPDFKMTDGETPRLLIIDDSLNNRLLLLTILEQAGFQVKTAENGEVGCGIQKEWQAHMVWMDIRMPVMGGIEATKIIRNFQSETQPVIIAVTASAFDEEKEEIMNIGCNDFVHKPYRESLIFEKIESHLGVHFIYDDIKRGSVELEIKAHGMDRESMVNDLASIPVELRRELAEALEYSDLNNINSLLLEIKKLDIRTYQNLFSLTEKYEYDKILTILNGVKKIT